MADFYLLGNTTDVQMFGCVVQTETKTVVFDGGTVNDSEQLASFLRTHAASNVDAWFFTHPHHDHIGSFCKIRENATDIKIGCVYYRFPPQTELEKCKTRNETEAPLWASIPDWNKTVKTHTVSVGDCFAFDGITVRVLRVYSPDIKENFINNSSAVYRIENSKTGKSILILGDLGEEGGEEVMANCPLELLQADYTQMAHHGQNGVDKAFYDHIKPKRCIWPSPDWLWNNDVGDGFDTFRFKTVRTREWMAALGVTEHYVEKDGIQKFVF